MWQFPFGQLRKKGTSHPLLLGKWLPTSDPKSIR